MNSQELRICRHKQDTVESKKATMVALNIPILLVVVIIVKLRFPVYYQKL